MSLLSKPKLMSLEFGISPSAISGAGLLDPILNLDTPLFIDPLLLAKSSNSDIASSAYDRLLKQFEKIVLLVEASARKDDKAWKAARRLLDLSECKETCLGYGGTGTSGSSRPDSLRETLIEGVDDIVRIGEKNPEIISLMGLFEEGVGPDTIGDLTSNVIREDLAKITFDFCTAMGVKPSNTIKLHGYDLPENPYKPGTAILLVPMDILRDLPLANDWSDVAKVVLQIEEIREEFNRLVGSVTKSTLTDRKRALKQAALQSLGTIKSLLESVLVASDHYDASSDPLNHYALRKMLAVNLKDYAGTVAKPLVNDRSTLMATVKTMVSLFKYGVEHNDLNELLWHAGKPKLESASQKLFWAMADVYCRANNIDIAPEVQSGGGAVDFRFSTGYENRVVVEMKRSSGSVVHGYTKQLEIYKSASRTNDAIYIVIDYGDGPKKIEQIIKLRNEAIGRGETASEIVIIDATIKASASKRT
jgi:hypothetical protein